MVFNFESFFGKNNEGKENEPKDSSEIFKMFDDANVALTGEARDIIEQATLDGNIEQENLDRLLELIKEADSTQDE